MDGPRDMDAIDLTTRDHRSLVELLERWERAGPTSPRRRQALLDEIVRATAEHVSLQERVLYPALVGAGEGEPQAVRAARAHGLAERALVRIQRIDPGNGEIDAAMDALIRFLRRHVAEEQQRVLPLFIDCMTEDRLRQVGHELQRAKRTAPTRPHPLVPRRGGVKRVADPMVAVTDRLRDVGRRLHRIHRRGRQVILGGLDL